MLHSAYTSGVPVESVLSSQLNSGNVSLLDVCYDFWTPSSAYSKTYFTCTH